MRSPVPVLSPGRCTDGGSQAVRGPRHGEEHCEGQPEIVRVPGRRPFIHVVQRIAGCLKERRHRAGGGADGRCWPVQQCDVDGEHLDDLLALIRGRKLRAGNFGDRLTAPGVASSPKSGCFPVIGPHSHPCLSPIVIVQRTAPLRPGRSPQPTRAYAGAAAARWRRGGPPAVITATVPPAPCHAAKLASSRGGLSSKIRARRAP